jgi:hypothetical protein
MSKYLHGYLFKPVPRLTDLPSNRHSVPLSSAEGRAREKHEVPCEH